MRYSPQTSRPVNVASFVEPTDAGFANITARVACLIAAAPHPKNSIG
jgi:hypothetical protein